MKKGVAAIGIIVLIFVSAMLFNKPGIKNIKTKNEIKGNCLIGAFIADKPTRKDIIEFKKDYGKKPYLVMIFVDWDEYPDLGAIKAILDEGSTPFITWEPWKAVSRTSIDYDKLLEGGYDKYITEFAKLIKSFEIEIFLRFAHEMNGNWYPWAGSKIGVDKYKSVYKHVKDIFDKEDVTNVKWVFSVNWEDVPPIEGNNFLKYYPGDTYVDYVGIDGYNWGNTQDWSKWVSFGELFDNTYNKATKTLKKPVLISEFSSASSGGDKAEWIYNAMKDIKGFENVKGFVVFNVDKEVDWRFPATEKSGKELRKQMEDSYFEGAI